MGGLGNQLFQYAFGRAQKEKGIEVSYDITNFRKNGHRYYMLKEFNVDMKFSPFLPQGTVMDSKSIPTFNINYLNTQNKNFFGYWQYIEYFKDILPVLKDEFSVKDKYYTSEYLKLKEKIVNDNSISVHVRRDDYKTSDTIDCLPLNYYYKALKEVSGNLYIFSDEIEWCRDKFSSKYFDREITFVESEYYLDFELMRFCKHNIIANSTFSWWAALLNDNHEKIVVTPDIWITKHDRGNRNNFSENWIKINV
jgi:hypothetical protein